VRIVNQCGRPRLSRSTPRHQECPVPHPTPPRLSVRQFTSCFVLGRISTAVHSLTRNPAPRKWPLVAQSNKITASQQCEVQASTKNSCWSSPAHSFVFSGYVGTHDSGWFSSSTRRWVPLLLMTPPVLGNDSPYSHCLSPLKPFVYIYIYILLIPHLSHRHRHRDQMGNSH
jgi:hypothetical protein